MLTRAAPVAQVLAASTLPPAVRAQLLAALAGFDPADPAQRAFARVGLRAFILAVQTQAAAERIAAAQAATWTAEATQIRAVLGCCAQGRSEGGGTGPRAPSYDALLSRDSPHLDIP